MRAVGGSRNGKIEKTRLVGIGMMLAGILSITFAVAGVSGAGTTAASPAHHVCADGGGYSSTTGQLAGAINKGCDGTTTTWHQCDCNTTTSLPVSTTTKQHCGCSTTTSTSSTSTSTTTSTSMPTTTSSSASTSTSTSMPVTSSTDSVLGETTTLPTVPGDIATTTGKPTISVKGVSSTLPAIAVEPTSGQLPFTGGSPFPLAAVGVVLLATGAGLARRKRNLA